MSVEVHIDANRLERLLRGPGSPGERLLRRRAEQAADRARRRAPGSMSRMITTRVEGRGRTLEAFITCHHPAAIYQEYGTRPHLIRPRRARALRFQAGGRTVYAAYVRHPGNPGLHFMRRALIDTF